eukprot:scaffold54057_cov28-Phaeocystis_antarctica.AAC.3
MVPLPHAPTIWCSCSSLHALSYSPSFVRSSASHCSEASAACTTTLSLPLPTGRGCNCEAARLEGAGADRAASEAKVECRRAIEGLFTFLARVPALPRIGVKIRNLSS